MQLQQEIIDRHNRDNRRDTVLLLGGLALLLAVVGWVLAGISGLVWVTVLGVASLYFGRRFSPKMLMRMYDARVIEHRDSPELHKIVTELARRAGLSTVPELYYVPSPVMNAFTTGRQEQAVIVVFDGLLRSLKLNELAGVLAHEMSHIKNNDIVVLGLADVVSRVTSLLPFAAIILGMSRITGGSDGVSWLTILVLLVAPQLSALLQAALSRSREFDADLDAATLTGDPRSLASALGKLEQYHGRMLERVLLPGRKEPAPSQLRTHPPTEQRVERLLSLEGDAVPGMALAALSPEQVMPLSVPTRSAPRWRLSLLWH